MVYRTELPDSDQVAIVALYDRASGDILHWHYSCADDGSELPPRQALEREAVEHATRHASEGRRKKLAEASLLHVDRQTLRSRGPFKVDTGTRALVKLKPA
jgi:hypothetical protein